MPFRDDREYRRKIKGLRDFVSACPGNHMVFTCRSRDYSEPLGLVRVEIDRLSDDRIQLFLARYLGEDMASSTWERLSESDLLELLRNPYYLLMFTQIVQEGGLWPAKRAGLFRGFVEILMRREKQRLHPDWPGEVPLSNALSALAAHMQPLGRGTLLPRLQALKAIPRRVLNEDNIQVDVNPASIYRLGLAATLLDTVLANQSEEQVRFYHHQLQEYFAARYLLSQFGQEKEMSLFWRQPFSRKEMPHPGELALAEPLPPPPTTRWEEPTILAAGMAEAPAVFISAVRAVNPVLAARCLIEPGLPVLADEVSSTQRSLLDMLGNQGVHLRARLAAGEALGELGDPRFEAIEVEDVKVLLPSWVAVPAGRFKMGSDPLTVWSLRRAGFSAQYERPRYPVEVQEFRIGKYPVTNAEFRCFWLDGGYQKERFWQTQAARQWLRGEDSGSWEDTEIGMVWRYVKRSPEEAIQMGRSEEEIQALEQLAGMSQEQVAELAGSFYSKRDRTRPDFWYDARFFNPSQPVVGITWFESNAYCTWLEEKLRLVGLLVRPSETIRLPTEAEWEYAARGGRGSNYPWGNRFDPERANIYEGHLRRTSPVGCYPQGVSRHGLHDLSGNVWEWTSSLTGLYPYHSGDGREDQESGGSRMVRGGSWFDDRWGARCAARDGGAPTYFSNDVGFRVVLSLADPGS